MRRVQIRTSVCVCVWLSTQQCVCEVQTAFLRRMTALLPRHHCHEGKAWEVMGAFLSCVFDAAIDKLLVTPSETVVKSGEWERHVFATDEQSLGREVLAELLGTSAFPSCDSKGTHIAVGRVSELALRRKRGTALRVRCCLTLSQTQLS